ncbi:MAG: LysM peptidoglycan-binding domain-containing protein [Chloroflexi bacterium]|nr:LysM peptidoglycan-binding domain-containing protein [Chloroflexota bacterium]
MTKFSPKRSVFRYIISSVLLLVTLGLFGCAAAQTYTVQPGDSLPDIALKYDVTLSDLIAANQDRYPALAVDPENPAPGTELVIPNTGDAGIDKWFGRLAQAASPPITPAPNVPAAPNEKINAVVQLIQRGINHERATRNLPQLVFDARLAEIAQARGNDMIRRAYFSHQDPERDSVVFQDLIRAKQYRFLFAGENIAEIKNQGSLVPTGLTVYARYGASEIANQFVIGWINSAEHRENILNPHFRKTGIALGVAVDGTRIVATQIFSD